MVYVRLVSDHAPGESDETPTFGEETITWIEGKMPMQVFAVFVKQGLNWVVDLTEAEENEASEWAIADVVARMLRAEKLGKTVLLDGELVSPGESKKMLSDFGKRTNIIPHVIDDNTISLILGLVEEENEAWKSG